MLKMMITVVVIYALCWLPLHTITLAGDADESIWTYRHIQTVWIASHWLAMSNCCYNPFVYYWMSSNFRRGYMDVVRRATCGFRCCRSCAAGRRATAESEDGHSIAGTGGSIRQRRDRWSCKGCAAATAVSRAADSDEMGAGGAVSTTFVDDQLTTVVMTATTAPRQNRKHSQPLQSLKPTGEAVQMRTLSSTVAGVPAITVTDASCSIRPFKDVVGSMWSTTARYDRQ